MPVLRKHHYKNRLKRALERGFTLVEMMIVVAIIGIISVLAYPAYQDYVARAQITESWNMIEIVRIRMWEYYAQHGTFPENAPTGRTTDPSGNKLYDLPPPAELGGRFVESVTVNSTGELTVMPGGGNFPLSDPADGVLVRIRPNAARPIAGKVIGFQMYIESNGAIRWVCTKKTFSGGISREQVANFGQVDKRLLPGACRTLD